MGKFISIAPLLIATLLATSANVNRWPPYLRDSVQLDKIMKLKQ